MHKPHNIRADQLMHCIRIFDEKYNTVYKGVATPGVEHETVNWQDGKQSMSRKVTSTV